MTNEERDIITRFIERVSGAQGATGFGSVPGGRPPLPPVDPEADALIGQLFQKYPEARYRLTQTAFVQEHALAEAQNRIQRLEYELQQAQQQLQQQAQQQPRSGGFLSSLFGGGAQPAPRPAPPPGPSPVWNQGQPQGYPPPAQAGYQPPPGQGGYPPPPQYAPGYQPGMFQRQGSGFLGSALTTAAGVAGGMVVGNALMDLFSPHRAPGADLGGGGGGLFPSAPAESPWGSPPASADTGYVDQGSWTTPDAGPDQASWDQGSDQGGGGQGAWTDPGSGDDSSWDTGGGDDDNLA